MQHDFQANAAFEGGFKSPKKSNEDDNTQKDRFYCFIHDFLLRLKNNCIP